MKNGFRGIRRFLWPLMAPDSDEVTGSPAFGTGFDSLLNFEDSRAGFGSLAMLLSLIGAEG
jgi:hypothetical protein